MENQEHTKASRINSFRVFKWGALVFGLLIVAAFGGLAYLVIPDLFGAVSAPEAVVRVERQASGLGHVSNAKSGVRTDDGQSTSALSGDGELARHIGPLIQDDSRLPKAVAAKRDELNREFAAVLRELERLDAEAVGLSFKETERRWDAIYSDFRGKVRRNLYDTWKAGDENRHLGLEPAYQPIHKKILQFLEVKERIKLENLVRHGRWRECAIANEYDHWDKWPQAVYYWRRLGGWEGTKHIISGAIYVRTRNVPILGPFRKLLPYTPEFQMAMVR